MLSHCSVMAKKHQKILQIRDKVSIFATSSRRDRLSGGGKVSSATADRCRGDAIYGKAFITRFVLDFPKSLRNLSETVDEHGNGRCSWVCYMLPSMYTFIIYSAFFLPPRRVVWLYHNACVA